MHDVLEIKLEKSNLDHVAADLVVVFAAKKPSAKEATKPAKGKGAKSEPKSPKENSVLLEGVSKSIHAKLHAAAEGGSITGAASEFVLFRDSQAGNAKHLAVIGLGELKDFDAEVLRQALATAFTQAKAAKVKSVAFGLDTLPKNSLSAEQILQVATEGVGLASYSFSEFKTGKKDERVATVLFVSNSKTFALSFDALNASFICFFKR